MSGCLKPWWFRVQEGGSLSLTGDCLQGTREGGAEPEERQAAQGQAEEAHGDVLLQPTRQAQGGWPRASSGRLPSALGSVHGGGGWARRWSASLLGLLRPLPLGAQQAQRPLLTRSALLLGSWVEGSVHTVGALSLPSTWAAYRYTPGVWAPPASPSSSQAR